MRRLIRTAFTIIMMFSLAMACAPQSAPVPQQPFYFAVQIKTQNDFRVALLDQTGETVLTLPGSSSSPSFSPDGNLYYAAQIFSHNWQFYQIYRLDLNTKETLQLSDGTTNDDSPAVSRASSQNEEQVAFVSHQMPITKPQDGYWRICLMDRQGKNRRFLDPTGEAVQFNPTWSPDGTKIAYIRRSTLEEIEKDQTMRSSLKIYDLATQTSRDILPAEYLVAYPSWSPQGDLIAFSVLEQKKISSLWVVRPDGTGARRLTSDHDDKHASWSPDGRTLLFSREEGNRRVICQVDLETSKVNPFFEKQLKKFLQENAEQAILEFPQIYFLPKTEVSGEQQKDEKK